MMHGWGDSWGVLLWADGAWGEASEASRTPRSRRIMVGNEPRTTAVMEQTRRVIDIRTTRRVS